MTVTCFIKIEFFFFVNILDAVIFTFLEPLSKFFRFFYEQFYVYFWWFSNALEKSRNPK